MVSKLQNYSIKNEVLDMKKLISILILLGLISHKVQASVVLLERSSFTCSDGIEYNVAYYYQGGWGPGQWEVKAFCNKGILKEQSYNARIMPIESSHPDIKACVEEDTVAVRSCYGEFAGINEIRGTATGGLNDVFPPRINHASLSRPGGWPGYDRRDESIGVR
jgi:hypothetical protein